MDKERGPPGFSGETVAEKVRRETTRRRSNEEVLIRKMKRGCAGMKRDCRVEKGEEEGLEKRLERRRRQVRGNQTGLKKREGMRRERTGKGV